MPAAAERRPRCARTAAIGAALAAAAACGSGPGITPIRTAFNRGVYHHSRGELDAAIAEYRAALREDPDDQRARFNLAAAYDEQGRAQRAAGRAEAAAAAFAQAEREYRAVPATDPASLRASVNLAALEFERGESAAGRARLAAAVTAHPDAALPRTALALRLLAADEVDAAAALLREALAIEPADVGANLLYGDACRRRGDVAAARTAYRAALRTEPADAGALLALARLERDAGNAAEAQALLEQLLLHQPRHLDAHLAMVDLCEAAGDLEGAVWHCWRARALDAAEPSRLDYRARLADLYRRLLAAESEAPARAEPRRQ